MSHTHNFFDYFFTYSNFLSQSTYSKVDHLVTRQLVFYANEQGDITMVSITIFDVNEKRADALATLINDFYKDEDEIKVKVVNKVKSKIMLVPTVAGEEMVYIKNLNYINIEERSLCYHLSEGVIKASYVLRNSFVKSINHYLHHENLLFIKPSLLINIANIKALNRDFITFKNGEILYYPKKHYDLIREQWINM